MVATGQPRAPRARGGRKGHTATGTRGGTVRASIQRSPLQWEGVSLDGSQMTAVGDS